MITEDFVSFEAAKLLKEKGFDEDCIMWYEGDDYLVHTNDDYGLQSNSNHISEYFEYSAPTHQMAMKWLREVHNKYIEICTDKAHNFKDIVFRPAIYDKYLDCLWESDNFTTYESAVEAALKYSLENLI